MDRLIEVTVDLHLERGDSEALRAERQRLLRLANEMNLIPAQAAPQTQSCIPKKWVE